MQTIGRLATGRDNNFNLIRAIAATAVLVSHAYPISQGPGTVQPLEVALGHTLGGIAVWLFFILSGYLITASFLRARRLSGFVAARVLRLYPGLIVSLLFVMFVLGPLATQLPVAGYFADGETWSFLARNIALIKPQYHLPGVFESQPYTDIEGSIWTLFHEVACYAGVFLAGIIGLLARRNLGTIVIAAYILAGLVALQTGVALPGKIVAFIGLSIPFAVGMIFYLWQDQIPLSLGVLIALCVMCWLVRMTPAFDAFLIVTLAYGLFWLGLVPGGAIRAYNRLGDYSYGIYIYAFPLQGFAVWMFGPQSPIFNMIVGMLLTIVPSVLSWHLIERPALSLRHRWTRA